MMLVRAERNYHKDGAYTGCLQGCSLHILRFYEVCTVVTWVEGALGLQVL